MNENIYQFGRLAVKRRKKKPMSDELYHFGILGMKWGKRNGPPYPLDYSQLSRDERDRAKGRAKREGNLDEAGRNRMYYSDQELRDVVNRFKLNKEVDQLLSEGNISKGEKRVKKITKTVRNIGDMMDALQRGTQNTINLYNKLRTVEANYMHEDFTPINTASGFMTEETKIRLEEEKAERERKRKEKEKKDETKHSLEMSDELYHFGILGMKWGKRNGPPYPLDSSISTGKRLKNDNNKSEKKTNSKLISDELKNEKKIPKNAVSQNLDKWGKTRNTNVLYITGLSGSGKSTASINLKSNDVDVINLDLFLEQNNSHNERNINFVKYLNENFSNYDDISTRKIKSGTKEFGKALDKFERCIDNFGKQQYDNKRKVIVEGVQLFDDTLYPDKTYFNSKPLIVTNTNRITSMYRGMKRDEIEIDLQDLKERIFWYNQSAKSLNKLKKSNQLKHMDIN